MSDSYDRLLAAQEDLTLMVSDLTGLSGQLEELATAVRRAGLSTMLELQPSFHKRFGDACHRLLATLHALVDAGVDQPPALAFSAVAQLSALENDISAVAAAAIPGDQFRREGPGTGPNLAGTLQRIRKRLWSLISHLAKIKELSLTGQTGTGALKLTQDSILVTFG
jgi:hypothetical protein